MSKKRFIQFIPSEEALYLLYNKPNAFRLLTIIAERARRYENGANGLKCDEAYIGDWKKCKMTEQEYRTAKGILLKRNHIITVETNRTRGKSTSGTTTEGTKVKLISTNVYDINSNSNNDRKNDSTTTDQRLTNDELIKNNKEIKKEIRINTSSISSDQFEYQEVGGTELSGQESDNRCFVIRENEKGQQDDEDYQTNQSTPRIKSKKEISIEAAQLTELLISKIKEVNPKFSQPTAKWPQDFDKLLKRRSLEDIHTTIEWGFSDLRFWRTKILSPSGLDRNFETIENNFITKKNQQGDGKNEGFKSNIEQSESNSSNADPKFKAKRHIVV